MNKSALRTILVVIGLLCVLGQASTEAHPAGFPISGADSVFETGLHEETTGGLGVLIGQLPVGYLPIQGNDETHWKEFAPIPDLLETLLEHLLPHHFSFIGTDDTFMRVLGYPKSLLNDTIPPQVTSFAYDEITGLLEFESNEFAVNQIWYGDAQDSYTHSISTTTWVKTHQVILPETNIGYV